MNTSDIIDYFRHAAQALEDDHTARIGRTENMRTHHAAKLAEVVTKIQVLRNALAEFEAAIRDAFEEVIALDDAELAALKGGEPPPPRPRGVLVPERPQRERPGFATVLGGKGNGIAH